MTERYIHAQYIAHLTTPFAIDPSLEEMQDSIRFTVGSHAVELKLGLDDHEPYSPYGDGKFEPGRIKSLLVDISGQGIASSGEYPEFLQSYEQILIEAARLFITWVRVQSDQWDLKDYFPVHSYNVEFYDGNARPILKLNDREINRTRYMLRIENAVGMLSEDHWNTMASRISQDSPQLLRLGYLLTEAKSLVNAGFPDVALVLAVSALEELCKKWIPVGRQMHKTTNGKKRAKSIQELAAELLKGRASPPVDHAAMSNLIQKRNALVHGRRKNGRSDIDISIADARWFIRTVMTLVYWKETSSPSLSSRSRRNPR